MSCPRERRLREGLAAFRYKRDPYFKGREPSAASGIPARNEAGPSALCEERGGRW